MKGNKSPRVSDMPVTTRSMRRAESAVHMKKASVVVVEATKPVSPAPPSEFQIYKDNVNKLFQEHVNCTDAAQKVKLYDVVMEYLVQPGMLKEASTEWFITWRAAVTWHINNTKTASSVALGKDVIAALDGYLESEGHYKVTTKRFIGVYDWMIDFAAKKEAKWVNVYATSLVAYMNRALPGVWKELALEKKSVIRARVMMWKEMDAPAGYFLVERCNEFLEKYKMI